VFEGRRARLAFTAMIVATILGAWVLPTSAQSPAKWAAGPDLVSGRCASTRYPDCRRLRFSFPVHVTPGANYQLIAPTVGKPGGDGYLTRISANLVRADGSVPRVDVIHLHHAVWVATQPRSGLSAFYGIGEEKTPMRLPDGYGWRVRPEDSWYLNFMIHNLTSAPETVYVTWEVDFVPRESAEQEGIRPVRPLAIEIRNEDRPLYPVFNIQRRFGKLNPRTGRRECTYPRDRCAAHDPYGEPQPGNGVGYDWTVPKGLGGTIVSLIGHLHPGGLRDELSLVRTIHGREVERRIFNFKAVYFDRGDPVSWDFAITVTPPRWRLRIGAGDRIRLNTAYDAERADWHEGMGIVYGFVAPGDRTGTDPFRDSSLPRTGPLPHGHLPENHFHGGDGARSLPSRPGPVVSDIGISSFTFEHGDLSRAERTGIPRVHANDILTFRNFDAFAGIWHTITSCRPPCSGYTGVSYPIADGRPGLDSLELGWTPPPFDITQASGQTAEYRIQPRRDGLRVGRTYTYFCRVHPFMRGAFKVIR
jgi:hypothetical protein